MEEEENDSLTLGEPIHWARDLALVGGLTTLALGLVTPTGWHTVTVAALLAVVMGAALGGMFPRLLHPRVRRKPVVLLLAAGVGLGACWGAIAGFTAALLTAAPWVEVTELVATATAIQLGWLWLPLVLGHAGRRRVVGWVTIALLVSPVTGWIAYQHVAVSEPSAPPHWTLADLPSLPPESSNGWIVVRDEWSRIELAEETHDRLTELQDARVPVHRRLAVYDRSAAALRIVSERHLEAHAAVERSLDRPHFADACPLELLAQCPALEIIETQHLVALRAVSLASQDRLPEALTLATRAVRAHLDLAESARGVMTVSIGVLSAQRGLVLLETLVALADRAQLRPGPWSGALRSLLERRESIDLPQVVRGEYILARRVLDVMITESRGSITLPLDARATAETVDDYYVALHAFAVDPTGPAPALPRPGDEPGAWLHNATGVNLVNGLGLSFLAPRIIRLDDQIAEIDASKAALRRAVRLQQWRARRG